MLMNFTFKDVEKNRLTFLHRVSGGKCNRGAHSKQFPEGLASKIQENGIDSLHFKASS